MGSNMTGVASIFLTFLLHVLIFEQAIKGKGKYTQAHMFTMQEALDHFPLCRPLLPSATALVGSSWQPVTAIVSHEGDGLRLL